MERFEGFADTSCKFFRALAKNQKREWFQAHKSEYEAGWQEPMKLLLGEVRGKVDAAYPHCELDEPKVFRIFRDVRFSKDKVPYKTHVGGILSVARAGKVMDSPAALYLQLGTECFAAAGHYMMEPAALTRFRKAVDEDARGGELAKLLARLEKKGFTRGGHDMLKRVPRGFDPAHPRAELLKHKGLIVNFPAVPTKLLASRELLDWATKASRDVAPLVEWLVFATAG